MTTPWGLLDAGLWLIFVAWAVAIHLCRDEPPQLDSN
jgi:hypothetical protein